LPDFVVFHFFKLEISREVRRPKALANWLEGTRCGEGHESVDRISDRMGTNYIYNKLWSARVRTRYEPNSNWRRNSTLRKSPSGQRQKKAKAEPKAKTVAKKSKEVQSKSETWLKALRKRATENQLIEASCPKQPTKILLITIIRMYNKIGAFKQKSILYKEGLYTLKYLNKILINSFFTT